jgi:hypothetical protein
MAKNINLAYIISAYKLPDNLIRMVERLNTEGSNFVIHVDKNAPNEVFESMKSGLKKNYNVKFVKRHKSPYRGFGHVRSTIKGLDYLSRNNIDYDYVFVLTGQDYPIKKNSEINSFLNKNYGKSFMEHFAMPTKNWQNGGMDRLDNFYIHYKRGYKKIPRKIIPFLSNKSLPNNLQPWGGSGYFTLFKRHAKYISKYINQNPGYINFFKHTDIPDEMFFQTILLNSRYKNEIVNDDMRYIDWSNPVECPSVLRISDLEKIKKSKDLIARKFDSKADSKILDRIDKELLNA